MDRVTRADLDRIAATVSEQLPGQRAVEVQGRNGHQAVDLYDGPSIMVDTLHVGTKREVYTYLQGMRRAQLLAR